MREVWRSEIEQAVAGGVKLLWAGPHRWVAQFDGRIQFITDKAPDPLPATDLTVTSSIIARDPQAVHTTALLRVENRGINPAPDTRLTFALPEGRSSGTPAVVVLSVSSNAVPTTNGLGGQSFALGDLAPGAAIEVTAELRGYEDGRLDASAFVGSSASDPDPKNNRAVIHTDGLIPTLSLRVTGPPADGDVPLEFSTLSGWNFEVQSAPTLNGPWGIAGAPIAGTGDTKTASVPSGDDTAHYWRVVLRLP
ncbi:MAG TPA: hypothetical protein VMB21_05975 [Candidatus Limnocylindria bacterium]|nr:hypothetical protein [Candidatus Limnocylindria bacterium]